mmetsp:Transcript_57197/g.177508  ORF Transcript_57197/g.177508 Transcript_57197/m.177508 type:complete len:161 (-) Transcript_57197:31-513(-)
MPRLSMSALLCLLALCGGHAAAVSGQGLLPASAGRVALLAAVAGLGSAEEAAAEAGEEVAGEAAEGEEAEGEEEGEEEAADAESLMAELDTDKDGLVSFEELAKAGADDVTDEDREKMKSNMKEVDTDGDGMMNKEELVALMKTFGESEVGEQEEEEEEA